MSFEAVLERFPLDECLRRIAAARPEDVDAALAAPTVGWEEFLALLSPAAEAALEPLARRARRLTRERFGRVVQLYAPLYVSSECTNACVYCGFHRDNPIRRTTLSVDEAYDEAMALWTRGFRSVLLVSGEAPRAVPVAYFQELARRLHTRFASVSIEIYPLGIEEYARLIAAGVDGLTIYQETYDRDLYRRVHPAGRKADYSWRLDAPARGAEAGMRRVGIGALLGLGEWRREAVALALHALWLQKRYWQTQVCVSFPRLRHAPGGFAPPHPVSDRHLVQLACALRLLLPDAGLVLSTREAPAFRDGLAPLCITHMSAGSCTQPGGYTHPDEHDGQFEVEDTRPPVEVARRLLELGIEPVWKDWDAAFTPSSALEPEGASPSESAPLRP
ncbi:MAG: 2-iminoacetate synthase ThiH [Deferrisomatales bacterium]